MPSTKNQDYAVEKIISKKTDSKGRNFYLIKWKGYSSVDNTWEPESNLANCQETLDEFESQQEQKPQSPSRSSQRLSRSPSSKRNSVRSLRKRPSETDVNVNASPKRLRNSATDRNLSSSSLSVDEPVDKSTIDRIVNVRRNKQINSIEYLIQFKKSKKNLWLAKDQLIDGCSQQIVRFLEDKYIK